MLIQYMVRNFKSIKDEVVINFSASDKLAKDEALISNGEYSKLYRAIGLVGPNASGKSNILESIFFALKFINHTISRKESSKINVEPFMLDENSMNEPTSFEFIFVEDGIKYVYGFSIDGEKVTEEYLMAYYSRKSTTVFDRDVSKEIKYDFKGNDVKVQTDISLKTNANRLYLPVAAEWGYEKLKAPYKWFERMVKQYGERNISEMLERILQNEELKTILLNSLKKADFNISDIFIKRKKFGSVQRETMISILSQMLGNSDFDNDIVPDSRPIVWVTHESRNGNRFSIELEEDSSGTKDIISDIAEFLYINHTGGLLLDDEMGRNYHTKLTEYFVNIFNDSTMNTGKAQMLFSTHDTKVLNILRPEQIYLVDKDEDGATFVKLLDDYLIREKDNIELGYLKGRYGAVPNIKEKYRIEG